MPRCIIIAPLYRGEERELLTPHPGDLLLCADGGYAAAKAYELQPDLVIGDFDSSSDGVPTDCACRVLPVHKDDTDLVVCIREGRDRGYREFLIAGALGGRMDHTIAALQCLKDCALRGEQAWLVDGQNRITVLTPGTYDLSAYRMEGRSLSLLAATPAVRGVTLTGTLWELQDAVLTDRYPLGISNQYVGDARLTFTEGMLYLGLCGDAGKQ